MGFTILPACVTQLFSLRWHRSDGSLKTVHWLLHFLLLGFLHRYLTLFYTAVHSLRNKSSFSKDKNWVYRQESDICMLHLFESFVGAAPQLILQLYIIAILHHAPLWTSASAIASFCSLTWAVSTYVRAMHNINRERNNATWVALALQALWRSGMLLSRIGVLVLAAVFLRAWFLLFLGLHWLFMTIWVILQNTEFCPTVWEERIYNCIIGLIYCFDFFNLRDGRSRYRVLVFYTVIAVQNLVFLVMYALRFVDAIAVDTMIAITSAIVGGMLVGLTSMLLYYGKFHPSRLTLTRDVRRDIDEHLATVKVDTPRSFKLFHRGSLVSLHHSIDISPRVTISEEVATDKQSLLTNVAQISDCLEEGIVNCNYNTENESVRVSTECEKPHSRAHKEETTTPKDNADNTLSVSATLSTLYQGLPDIDDAEAHHRQKRRGICLPITHGLDTEKKILSEVDVDMDVDVDVYLSSRKRRGIYEHGIATQLDWLSPDISSIDLNLDEGERNNSLTLDSCSKVIGALDAIKNRSRLTTPTQLEGGRIFDIEKVSKDLQREQQRDETMSCVTSIHDYENVCPLGIARPPWCIRSWKGYTDIETYIHDDSVVRDRRRDTLTSTTGTTYSSEYSDGVCGAGSLISRGILKQDDYADTLVYDFAESKDSKSLYDRGDNDVFTSTTIEDQNAATLYIAKPVVIDDRGGMLALDTIMEERDDSVSSEEGKFQRVQEATRDSASTLVSTIDQIRRYTAENSPRHVYHTTGTQWEDLNPKNLMARARFAKVLFDNDLKTGTMPGPVCELSPCNDSRAVDKREIEAIREFVKCCAIESIKKTPLIEAILSDSPILGSRGKLVRQVTFADCKGDFDANESDLYVEMSPLVSVENGENSCASKLVDSKTSGDLEISAKRNLPATSKESLELFDKENLAPISSYKSRKCNNNDDDRRAWTIERDDKADKSLCNVRFSLKEKRHIFLEQVLSPPKLWNKRISFHPSTKNL
ncbi:uncharacterized protein LOC116847391 isoform X2 [Odontomachus brunneus]|nr:uncharacterized protein LOC116847391 isoform X2 [Odontomachus brunneus]